MTFLTKTVPAKYPQFVQPMLYLLFCQYSHPLFFKPSDHNKMMKKMKITDKSYLEHMIPHHQVAIDMSHRLLLHTNNSYLLEFCRKLIVDQQYEISYMTGILNKQNYSYKSKLLLK